MAAIKDLLLSTTLGEAVQHGSLTMIPIMTADVAQLAPDYPVLDEAIASGRFLVSEVSEEGSVPHLLALNHLDEAVLLLDGEELVGAKQNRVLNMSVLVPALSQTVIPVSCVEAGRWHRRSENFTSAPRAQFAEGRARKMRSVSRSLETVGTAMSDQREVWDLIAEKSARMAAPSDTAAMSDIFERSRSSIDDYVQAMRPRPGQLGAVFAIGERIIGLDVFGSADTWAKLGAKVTASYALDAIEARATPAIPANVSAFIDAMLKAAEQRFAAAGAGETVRLGGCGIAGAALEVDGHCLHLAAFPA